MLFFILIYCYRWYLRIALESDCLCLVFCVDRNWWFLCQSCNDYLLILLYDRLGEREIVDIERIMENKDSGLPPLAPPPKKPTAAEIPKYSIVSRRGAGGCGRPISLLSNHFKVAVNAPDQVFYQYSVCSTLVFCAIVSLFFKFYVFEFAFMTDFAGYYYFRRSEACWRQGNREKTNWKALPDIF